MATVRPDAVATPQPGSRGYLKWYWTKGPGLAKWIDNPHPWTALYLHLVKHLSPAVAKRVASQWFHDATGMWPAERKGLNPLGKG